MRRVMVVAAFLMAAAAVAAAAELTETFDQAYPMAAGGRVGLENINGDVTVEVWDRDEVRVYAIKRASSPARLAGLRIEVEASGDRVFIDTDYPSSRDLADDDRHGHSEVEYTLTVPRFAILDEIELVNGDLLVDGVQGGVEVDSVNGEVILRDVAGELEIDTVNGDIEIDIESSPSAPVDLSTVNGTIDVRLAGSAEIVAETVNGRISNDFGIEVKKGKYVGSSMRGLVGGGGTVIELESVNGGIAVGPR